MQNLSTDDRLFIGYYDATPVPICCKSNYSYDNGEEYSYNVINQEFLDNLSNATEKKKQLPVNKVSNTIHFYREDELIMKIMTSSGDNCSAIYWTDLLRRPIEIAYHSFFDSVSKEWVDAFYDITDGCITGHRLVDAEKGEGDQLREIYYKDASIVKEFVLSRFSSENMLHIQCADMDISIRKLPCLSANGQQYVIVESECNNDEGISRSGVIRY